MGCGNSQEAIGSRGSQENSVVQHYDRKPKISVRMGPSVKFGENDRKIVFIFGGPGSRKGRIVDDLVTSYGFKLITGEEIIREELPQKVSQSMKIQNVREIQHLLEEEPSHLTMQWVFKCIEKRIERDNQTKLYLIDILPNLKYLLRIQPFFAECEKAFLDFEGRFPISFAIDLAVPKEKVIVQQAPVCAVPSEQGGKSDEADSSRTKGNKEETSDEADVSRTKDTQSSPSKDLFIDTSSSSTSSEEFHGDEVDHCRTQKRLDLYESSVKSFLDFFNKTERMVMVDVTSGVADHIWNGVKKFMSDLEVYPKRVVNTVIIFAFKSEDLEGLDLGKYHITSVTLRDIVEDPSGPVESMLMAISTHLDNNSTKSDAFLIDVSGTSLVPEKIDERSQKPLTFHLVDENHLEQYLPGTPKGWVPADTPLYKAVASSENEMCLFPVDIEDATCRRISGHVAATRDSQFIL